MSAPEGPHVRLALVGGRWVAHAVVPGEPEYRLFAADSRPPVLAVADDYAHDHGVPLYEHPVPPPPQDNSELPEHDVAVVVFARVRAVDNLDAASMAERVVAGAIREAMKVCHGANHEPYGEIKLRDLRRNLNVPVVVTQVVHLGIANGDGYLHTEPTGKAYQRFEERYPLCECGQRTGRHPYYSTCPRRDEP